MYSLIRYSTPIVVVPKTPLKGALISPPTGILSNNDPEIAVIVFQTVY
jgi:hypothetical protein